MEAFAKDCSPNEKPQIGAGIMPSWKMLQKQKAEGQTRELLKVCLDVALKLQVILSSESCTLLVFIKAALFRFFQRHSRSLSP